MDGWYSNIAIAAAAAATTMSYITNKLRIKYGGFAVHILDASGLEEMKRQRNFAVFVCNLEIQNIAFCILYIFNFLFFKCGKVEELVKCCNSLRIYIRIYLYIH